jgi:hypothetical protein
VIIENTLEVAGRDMFSGVAAKQSNFIAALCEYAKKTMRLQAVYEVFPCLVMRWSL